MAINVFEGGRRITRLVVIAVIIGWSLWSLKNYIARPLFYVNYIRTDSVGAPMKRVQECPPSNFGSSFRMKTKTGTRVFLTFCKYMNPYYNYELSLLDKNQMKAAFTKLDDVGNTDEEWADTQWWAIFLKAHLALWGTLVTINLLFLWFFAWLIGWVVRGFMGIPKGQDHKIE